MLRKKRGMIDVRELHKKGIVRVFKDNENMEINTEGFLEVEKPTGLKSSQLSHGKLPAENFSDNNCCSSEENPPVSSSQGDSNSGFFNLFDSAQSSSFSNETNGYSKREVDSKIESLDNKIYRLEQRIELLERKTGVGDGW